MVTVCAPAPVMIFTSPAASMLVRSLTFSTAFLAVGEQTPALQFMFCVALVEIVTDAYAAPALISRVTQGRMARTSLRTAVPPKERSSIAQIREPGPAYSCGSIPHFPSPGSGDLRALSWACGIRAVVSFSSAGCVLHSAGHGHTE